MLQLGAAPDVSDGSRNIFGAVCVGDVANKLEAIVSPFESLFSVKFCWLRYFSVFTRTAQPRRAALFVKTVLFYPF